MNLFPIFVTAATTAASVCASIAIVFGHTTTSIHWYVTDQVSLDVRVDLLPVLNQSNSLLELRATLRRFAFQEARADGEIDRPGTTVR